MKMKTQITLEQELLGTQYQFHQFPLSGDAKSVCVIENSSSFNYNPSVCLKMSAHHVSVSRVGPHFNCILYHVFEYTIVGLRVFFGIKFSIWLVLVITYQYQSENWD